jgi:hypothetical protein
VMIVRRGSRARRACVRSHQPAARASRAAPGVPGARAASVGPY